MEFCVPGNHAITGEFCKDHPPQRDPPASGRCAANGGHPAKEVWYVGLDGKWYCQGHLRRIVFMALWRPR